MQWILLEETIILTLVNFTELKSSPLPIFFFLNELNTTRMQLQSTIVILSLCWNNIFSWIRDNLAENVVSI